MKANKNNVKTADYYIGLDVGTSSVGFAATDKEYNLKKHAGKSMWGVRIFDEGETAEARRVNRANRRRLARRNQRLELLNMIFDKEITSVDSGFFMRLKESFLCFDEKTKGTKYSLFADKNFTDRDYLKKYPTIYHLRQELATVKEPHDVRLVYLAIRHILKNRGHFLFDVDSENSESFEKAFDAFLESLYDIKNITLNIDSTKAYEIITRKASKSDRVKELVALCNPDKTEKKAIEKLFGLLVGGTSKLSDIFEVETTVGSISFDMGDEKLLEAAEELGNDFDIIYNAKAVYDCLILEKITKGYSSISEYKIFEYEQHKSDVKLLKIFIKQELKDADLYKEIFVSKKEKLPNYSAYSGYKKGDQMCHATQEEFCKYLRSKLPKEYEMNDKYSEILRKIQEGSFAPKLKTTENGVIPNSLHRSELVSIINNASTYLPFLNEVDSDGISVKEKIISIFDFKIPYYVGPLKGHWAVKDEGSIYPWNFENKVNLEKSAENFITKMTSACTYTGEDVLPKNSLLYSEFEVLNEINNIKINGAPISVECKKKIYQDLFVKSNKKVTKKSIERYLMQNGLLGDGDLISGIDDNLKSQLTSYHKLKNIIAKTSYEQTEEIIRRIVLFGDDKKLLRKYIESETDLDEEDVKYILKQKFSDWGRLSKVFLNGIESVNRETGEVMTVIEMLRETNNNLMKLLSKEYSFKEQADEYKAHKLGIGGTPRQMVEALYVSPKIRRSIWQALRILDEIVDIERGAPKKIFIEVARENEDERTKKSNEASRRSRKEQLLSWYKECKESSGMLYEKLSRETDESLRAKKLYLYYMQFGKCMYSGEPINLGELDKTDGMGNLLYDIDHIYPRSKIKDDSFDNLVLVKSELNRKKTNVYPISGEVRAKMNGFWLMLKERGTISPKKYERLIRHTPLTMDELTSFVNRQLVETRQSTKAIAEVLKVIYPETKIVYSKAGNVSDFRKLYSFTKCRDINDHHHAKDAYLNIVVGNYFDTRFTADFMKNILTEEYSLNPETLYSRDVKGAFVSGENGTIATVRKTMAKNNVLFTVMPKEERGQLYDVTIMKKGSGQVPIKNGLDIDKYGGYNKASGAYFALVEHEEKGKKIRTIEAVLIYQKNEYEKNPEAFARTYWYNNAKVIIKRILMFSILEFDGIRYNLRGRADNRLLLSHTAQLSVDEEKTRYIKHVLRYIDDCKNKQANSSVITRENNLKIYDWYIEKIDTTLYHSILENIGCYLKEKRTAFLQYTVLEQCEVLKETLKAFQCNASLPSFSKTPIRKPKKMSCKEAYLINQSVTGIFETKINLLK